MRSLRSRVEEVERLDAAIADALKGLETCLDARRSAELRLKLNQLRAKRGRVVVSSWNKPF